VHKNGSNKLRAEQGALTRRTKNTRKLAASVIPRSNLVYRNRGELGSLVVLGSVLAILTQATCQRGASDMVHDGTRYSNTETIGDIPKGIRPCLTVLEFRPACVAGSPF
jgi:hypothetical protein